MPGHTIYLAGEGFKISIDKGPIPAQLCIASAEIAEARAKWDVHIEGNTPGPF
jgi:hypothetical protein